MPLPSDKAWFPAKRYGWGWGFPARREGWIVFGAYLVGLIAAALVFGRNRQPVVFISLVWAWSSGLVFMCWWKGEKPRWRWGADR